MEIQISGVFKSFAAEEFASEEDGRWSDHLIFRFSLLIGMKAISNKIFVPNRS
jgi:hypothetical protein